MFGVRFVEVWAVCPVCRAGRRFVVCQWRFDLSGNPVCFQFFSVDDVWRHCVGYGTGVAPRTIYTLAGGRPSANDICYQIGLPS